MKHILNSAVNVVLLEPWSYSGNGRLDSFLMGELGPWLHGLFKGRELGLEVCRSQSDLGRPPICEDGSNPILQKVLEAIRESKRMGFCYTA